MELTAKNICKSYGDTAVLSGFSHTFEEGSVTAVMGASGCGKSTLLSILMGTLPADSGEVLPKDGIRHSAVFQENRLCENLTAAANLRLVTGGRYTPKQLGEELAAVGLADCGAKPVRELSGGMKRRVALLRALLHEYDVLFLDEPFKGLDEDTKQQVMEYCRLKTAGKTVILVTHDRAEAELLADRIIYLDGGDEQQLRRGSKA